MEVFSLKGSNGILKVYEDKVVLSRNTVNGILYQGIKGDRIFFYNNLSGIEYRKPGFWANGYIKFIVAGTIEEEQKSGFFGISNSKSLKDSNTLVLVYNKEILKKADKVYEYILDRINKCIISNTTQTTTSSADEIMKFKKLLDDGVIIQEEFEKKKKELL